MRLYTVGYCEKVDKLLWLGINDPIIISREGGCCTKLKGLNISLGKFDNSIKQNGINTSWQVQSYSRFFFCGWKWKTVEANIPESKGFKQSSSFAIFSLL